MFDWLFKKVGKDVKPNPNEIGERKHDDITKLAFDDIPRYPPFLKGLPAVDPKRLLETQAELVQRIRNSCNADEDTFNKHYRKPLERFAEFVHLLPASQSHHHRGAGGLLRHSLEVSLFALQDADRVIVMPKKPPAVRREIEIRWQAACFLAGLCHDAGKPIGDLFIRSHQADTSWNPLLNSLYEWANSSQVKYYYLEWRSGRGKQHVPLATLISERLIGHETLGWLAEHDKDIIIWLVESLSGTQGGKIYDLVLRADKLSVERDLKDFAAPMAGYDIGVPTESYLIDVMRRLVKKDIWTINTPGSRVWKIDGKVYLVWPISGEEMVREISKDNVPAVPRSPQSIADMLCERGYVSFYENGDGEKTPWFLYPECLTEKIDKLSMGAIQLKDDSMISEVPIRSINGTVSGQAQMQLALGKKDGKKADAANEAVPIPSTEGPISKDAKKPKSIPKPEIPTDASANSTADDPAPKTQENVPDPAEAASTASVTLQSTATKTEKPLGAHESNVVMSSSDPAPVKAKMPKLEVVDISTIEGAIGEAIRALISDCSEGTEKRVGDHIRFTQDETYLRWPEAFAGYGLTAKDILAALIERKWLILDMEKPMLKTWDIDAGEGQTLKALRLMPQLGLAIKQKLQKPLENTVNPPEKAPMPAPEAEVNGTATPQVMVNATSAPKSPEEIEELAATEKSLTKIKDLVKSIKGLQDDIDGWVELEKKHLSLDNGITRRDMLAAQRSGLLTIGPKRGICRVKLL